MLTVERGVVVNRPIEQVFTFVANFENEPLYNPSLLSMRKTSPGPIEDALLFLEAHPNAPSLWLFPAGNIRVLVPNVDDYWALSQQMGARVIRPLGDRSYRLRDFTIAGPDGLGLRFATRLSDLVASNTGEHAP